MTGRTPLGLPEARLLWILLAVALLLRLAFWLPSWQPGDALGSYAATAHRILAGEYQPGAAYSYAWFSGIRLGVVLPTALLVAAFGHTMPLLALYPLLCSLLTLGFIYGIGRHLEARFPHAALLAVGVAAVYPLLVTQAPLLLHDTPRTLFTTAGLYFFLRARGRDYDRANLLLSGLAFGLSYLCAISVLFLLPGLAAWIVWQREVRARQLWIVVGMLAVVGFETAVLSLATGKVFVRGLALTQSVQDVGNVRVDYPGISRWIPGYWEAFISPTTSYFILHGLCGWISMAAVAWSFYRRDALLLLCALCWLADSAILNFGPMPSIETRYLLAGIPLLCLMTGALLSQWLRFPRLVAAAGVLLLVSSLVGCWLFRMTYAPTNDVNEVVIHWLQERPELTPGLVASKRLRPMIRYASGYRVDPAALEGGGAGGPGYVLCLFNGYFPRQDLPDRYGSCRLAPIEEVRTGAPYLTRHMGRLRPKIGFESQLVLYRLEDCDAPGAASAGE